MATTALQTRFTLVSPTRQRILGVLYLALAFLLWFAFIRTLTPDVITTFGMTPGGLGVRELAPWELPSRTTVILLAAVTALVGGVQLARGFGRWSTLVLGLMVGAFVFGFLVWSAAGKSLNLAGLLRATLSAAVPITLGALSGVLCERAGVVNIAIEGMMLGAAMTACVAGSVTHSLWIGLITGILTGALLAAVHAVLSIKYKTNQIISGTVINIFSTGMTSFISARFLQTNQALNDPGVFRTFAVPGLVDIPLIGPILFHNNLFVYIMFVLLFVLNFALFSTRWGLRLRSVGEHPKAADTLGINVFRTRYMAVILGGMVAGFAGSYFTLGSVGRFDEVMTAGRGFIGLAAMIFGNWTPFGSFGAGLLFGFANSLAAGFAILGSRIPSEFMLMAPYVATILVLAGVVGRGHMPAADGTPYEKE
jgi:simple sugar transport system permease protein